MAALLLADGVVTMMPTPPSGRTGSAIDRAAARRAADEAPGYAAFMDALSWAAELFREGVVGSIYAGEDAADDVHDAWLRIRADDALSDLRPFMRDRLYDDDRSYLSALAADLLRGGPDPAVSIPLAAGIDAFAGRHGLPVARAAATSVVQQFETNMQTERFRLVMPVLVQASADRLLEARELFEHPLEELRAALDAAIIGGELDQLREAAERYTAAFESEERVLLGPGVDEHEVRPIAALVSVAAVEMPRDVVLRSSVSAARRVAEKPAASTATVSSSTASEACLSLIIRQIGAG